MELFCLWQQYTGESIQSWLSDQCKARYKARPGNAYVKLYLQTLSLSVRKYGLPRWLSGKESACKPWVGKMPWRRKWQPTLVFLPREFHGQRSLVGCKSIGSQTVRHDLATEHTHKEVYTLRLTPKLSIIKEL